MTSKEIARDLDIAPNTVDQRVKAAWKKLGATDRSSAARQYALLKSICGQTTYGEPAIDFNERGAESLPQDLPDSAFFFVEDSTNFRSFETGKQSAILEALDVKFGPIGRVAAILVGSTFLAVVLLVVTSVAVTMGDLF